MTSYEKAVSLWRQKNITSDAELAEALYKLSNAFAYHSGKLKMRESLITAPEKSLSMMVWHLTPEI